MNDAPSVVKSAAAREPTVSKPVVADTYTYVMPVASIPSACSENVW